MGCNKIPFQFVHDKTQIGYKQIEQNGPELCKKPSANFKPQGIVTHIPTSS